MKIKALIASLSIAVSAAVANPAQALLFAGWDFSPYFGDGLLSVDGENLVDTLPANFSSFDPTFGAGAESGPFGTLYLNGQFGSTQTPLDISNDPIVPSAAAGGSLSSNLSAPGAVPFDSCSVLAAEGQAFCNLQVLTALSAASVVFEADPAQFGSDWVLTLAGKTFAGTSSVAVEFSTDGSSYVNVGTLNLTTLDTLFTVNLGAAIGDSGFVRLSFAPSGVNQPFIDNVAISGTPLVPEPGTALLLVSGLVGLSQFGRRRD